MPRSSSGESGFSLIESVVACALLTVGLLSLAQLFAMAVSTNVSSKQATFASILAAQKAEELRTMAEPVSGVEFVDARGSLLPYSGDAPPSTAAFVRRWTFEPLAVDPLNSAAIQVTVTPIGRGPGLSDVSLASVRWRRLP